LVATGDAVAVGVSATSTVAVSVAVDVKVGSIVSVAVADAASVGVKEGVPLAVADAVTVAVADDVGVSVGKSVDVIEGINVGNLVSVMNWSGVKGKVTVAAPAGLDKVRKTGGVKVAITPLIVASEVGVIIAGGKVGEGSCSAM
jgi:hypothetical protein